jgi:catechol 2,3-dioxygenase-like lactoylglutathione lyase family enzyme
MIGYVTLGTNDIARASAFYDALLSELGAKRVFDMDRIKFYGATPGAPMLAVCIPYDQGPAHPGNGTMVSIPVKGGLAQITRLYNKALALGATDEGAPGERIPGVFTGAYVRDLDGNKLCFFEMKMG